MKEPPRRKFCSLSFKVAHHSTGIKIKERVPLPHLLFYVILMPFVIGHSHDQSKSGAETELVDTQQLEIPRAVQLLDRRHGRFIHTKSTRWFGSSTCLAIASALHRGWLYPVPCRSAWPCRSTNYISTLATRKSYFPSSCPSRIPDFMVFLKKSQSTDLWAS